MSCCPNCGHALDAAPKPRLGLTRMQKRALDFIVEYAGKNGVTPSYTEIRDALGLKSKSNINRLVEALHDRGHIERTPKMARSIALLDRPPHLASPPPGGEEARSAGEGVS